MKTVAIAIMTMVLLLAAGYLLGAVLGLVFGLVSTAATKLLYLWNDDKFAPQRRGGRRVQEHEAPELVATLRELARRAGIPVPNLYVIESPTKANALAAGRGRRHAAICVTTGLLHAVSRDELAGVLAHELGHVLRRSAVIKTTAAVLGAAVSLLPPFGIFFGLGIGVSLLLMFAIPPAAVLLQLAIARADEYAADEYGARLTGRPDVVAGLLGRIALVDDAGSEDMANSAMGRTMLAIGRRIVGPRRDNPFSAYPLPANRAVELARLAHEMGAGCRRAIPSEPLNRSVANFAAGPAGTRLRGRRTATRRGRCLSEQGHCRRLEASSSQTLFRYCDVTKTLDRLLLERYR
jgi:heat shock protein HtpX